MTDKEVGELWRFTLGNPGNMTRQQQSETLALIRKLVEEALSVYLVKYGRITCIHEDAVFKRFGIDPETW